MNTRILLATLALVVILGTVAPVTIEAQDSAIIINSVQTSSNTGGQNGADGADGAPGENGADGADGQSISTNDERSSASLYVETTVDGETIVQFKQATSGSGEVSLETNATTTLEEGVASGSVTSSIESVSDETIIRSLLQTIRVILLKYASILF